MFKLAYIDRTIGQSGRLAGELRLVSERLTAGDLVRRRIEQTEAEGPERPLNGSMLTVEKVATALENGQLLMLLDGRQILSVSEVVVLRDDSKLTFIWLTPLAGG